MYEFFLEGEAQFCCTCVISNLHSHDQVHWTHLHVHQHHHRNLQRCPVPPGDSPHTTPLHQEVYRGSDTCLSSVCYWYNYYLIVSLFSF